MTERPLTQDDLRQFTGTETWHRHSLVRNIVYTDGVEYMAERAGAYWLIDEIVLANGPFKPINRAVQSEEFQHWKLTKDTAGNGATLSCEDGGKNGHDSKVVYSKHIEFTDFPLPKIDLYFIKYDGDTLSVLMLPSEY